MLEYAVADEVRQSEYLGKTVVSFVDRISPQDLNDAGLRAASDAIRNALIATVTYIRDRRDRGAQKSDEIEANISRLWIDASPIVAPFDAALANACLMKGLGWTDPTIWEQARHEGLKIGVTDMQSALMALNRKRQENMRARLRSWSPWAGLGFCVATVAFLMYFLMFGPSFDPQKKIVFDILMAFCAAGSAAFIGGEAAARGNVPFFQNSPVQFSAIGGIGTLIVVFLILHYST
ncbi:MAG TPA: hypothetical protein VGX95_00105 [Xanthobacteraceae bacterium]|jgi:hypothetical protein|nr:hypothetical protein [Xanthobacteraceae bacterium]